ncbi:hypothetical protein BLIN9172_00314, partial [Brevibacterium linens ATCC 9172]
MPCARPVKLFGVTHAASVSISRWLIPTTSAGAGVVGGFANRSGCC